MTYLQPRQEYIDRYDRITIEDCRRRENFHKSYVPAGEDRRELLAVGRAVSEVALYFDLLYTTLDWWERKTETVQKWMDEDAERDRLLETAHAPEDIRCLKCFSLLTTNDKILYDLDENRKRVLFLYDCPTCEHSRRSFFDDGEEYKVKREQCPKCQTELIRTHERIEDKKIVNTDTCPQCGYTNTFEYDLSVREEKPDSDFEKDRARFCLTEETARKAQDERYHAEQAGKLAEEWKEKEKHKADYDAVAKIRKLNVLDLEKLIIPPFEEAGYVRLQFGTPEITKDFFLPFTVYDNKSERKDRASAYDLTRLIKKCLEDTNWRLMSDGINYRLGFLTGRLRAYEREEDLLGLVRNQPGKLSEKP